MSVPGPTLLSNGTYSVHPDIQTNVDPSRVHITRLNVEPLHVTCVPHCSGGEKLTKFRRITEGSSLCGHSVINKTAVTIAEIDGATGRFIPSGMFTLDSTVVWQSSFAPAYGVAPYDLTAYDSYQSSSLVGGIIAGSQVVDPVYSPILPALGGSFDATYLTGDAILQPVILQNSVTPPAGLGVVLSGNSVNLQSDTSGTPALALVTKNQIPNYIGALVSADSKALFFPDSVGPVYVEGSTGSSLIFSQIPSNLSVGSVIYLDLPSPKVIDTTFVEGAPFDSLSIRLESSTLSPVTVSFIVKMFIELEPNASSTVVGAISSSRPVDGATIDAIATKNFGDSVFRSGPCDLMSVVRDN